MTPSRGHESIEPTPRDIAILRALFESRVMALHHVTDLFFDGKEEEAKKRVQKLKVAGLITEGKRRLYEPSILYFTQSAFRLLSQHDHLAAYPLLQAVKARRKTLIPR